MFSSQYFLKKSAEDTSSAEDIGGMEGWLQVFYKLFLLACPTIVFAFV